MDSVFTPSSDSTPLGGGAKGGVHSAPKRRRHLPSPTEQARRKAWGRKWGAVGHDFHVALEAEENK